MLNNEIRSQIVTSTGELGLNERSYDRLYWNWPNGIISDVSVLERAFRRMVVAGELRGKTRNIFRAPVDQKVMQGVLNSSLRNYIEVAFPLPKEISQDGIWLLSVAKNQPSRQSLVPVDVIVYATSHYENSLVSINERLQSVMSQGFVIQNRIFPHQIEQVFDLWRETFGWTKEEVVKLSEQLDIENSLEPFTRSVWFTALEKEGEVITAAMAERLSLPLAQEQRVELVESTEWRTKPGWERQGLMTATVAHLNCQILCNLNHNRQIHPLIFAETNFNSRSDLAASGAGMVVPKRQMPVDSFMIPQVLVQNVEVGDGRGAKGLRDFIYVYLPQDAINNFYPQREVEDVLQLTQRE